MKVSLNKNLLLYCVLFLTGTILIWFHYGKLHFFKNYILMWDESQSLLWGSYAAEPLRNMDIIGALKMCDGFLIRRPFLHYFLSGLFFSIFGAGFFSIKVMGYLAIMISLTAVFFICRRLDRRWGGLLALAVSLLTVFSPSTILLTPALLNNGTIFMFFYVLVYFLIRLSEWESKKYIYLYSLASGIVLSLMFFIRPSDTVVMIMAIMTYFIYHFFMKKKVDKIDLISISLIFFPCLVLGFLYSLLPPFPDRAQAVLDRSGLSYILRFAGIAKGGGEWIDFWVDTLRQPLLYYFHVMPFAFIGAAITTVMAILAVGSSLLNIFKDKKLALLAIVLFIFVTSATFSKRYATKYLVFIPPLIHLTGLYGLLCLCRYNFRNVAVRVKGFLFSSFLMVYLVFPILNFDRSLDRMQKHWFRDFDQLNNPSVGLARKELFDTKAPFLIVEEGFNLVLENVRDGSKIMQIGTCAEFNPYLLTWFLKEKAHVSVDISLAPFAGTYFGDWLLPDWNEEYRAKLAALLMDGDLDYIITFKIKRGSIFDNFDFQYNSEWQNNYIYLLDSEPDICSGRLKPLAGLSQGGVELKIYECIAKGKGNGFKQ